MFSTNKIASAYRKTGATLTGEATYVPLYRNVKIAMLVEGDVVKGTPLRSGSSASHGHADYDEGQGTCLFPKGSKIKIDDIIIMDDFIGRVTGVQFINDLYMKPQHVKVIMMSSPDPFASPDE